MSETKFENVFLSRRNQNILKFGIIEICEELGYKIPKQLNLNLLSLSLTILEETIAQHRFEAKKLSWINMEVLSRLMQILKKENTYWEMANILKEERMQKQEEEKSVERIVRVEKLIKSPDFNESMLKRLENKKDTNATKKSKVSDLFEY